MSTTTVARPRPLEPRARADDARLMAHAYDGIHEYDNPLPGWWRAIFSGSIVFAAGYWVWFHVAGWGRTPEPSATRGARRVQRQEASCATAAEAANVNEDRRSSATPRDAKLVEHGAADLRGALRRAATPTDGRGLIGPNLTDLLPAPRHDADGHLQDGARRRRRARR